MIIDTSAVLAILFDEADAEVYAQAIADAEFCRISAANFVEAAIVVESHAADRGSRQFDAFIRQGGILVESVTEEQAHLARQAWSDFGKGRHAAGLNFGDCFAYALAKSSGEPLLFKGNDFRKTDVVPAL